MIYRISNETNFIECLPKGRGQACDYRKQKLSRIRHRLTNEKYQIKHIQRNNILSSCLNNCTRTPINCKFRVFNI